MESVLGYPVNAAMLPYLSRLAELRRAEEASGFEPHGDGQTTGQHTNTDSQHDALSPTIMERGTTATAWDDTYISSRLHRHQPATPEEIRFSYDVGHALSHNVYFDTPQQLRHSTFHPLRPGFSATMQLPGIHSVNSKSGTVGHLEDILREGYKAMALSNVYYRAQKNSNPYDIQGVRWDFLNTTRERFRELRLLRYRNYENLGRDHETYRLELPRKSQTCSYFTPESWRREPRCSILHFQLRNMIWAVNSHDVYHLDNGQVSHWCALEGQSKPVANVYDIQVSTLCAKNNLLAIGGFQGELFVKRLDNEDIWLCRRRLSTDENAITNGIDITSLRSGALHIICCNNDAKIRFLDVETLTSSTDFMTAATCSQTSCNSCSPLFQKSHNIALPWAVNYAHLHPDKRMLCAVGDDPSALLIDTERGETIGRLDGHLDYSFACTFSPNEYLLATGNQDMTTRIYDLRKTTESIAVLPAVMSAIRALRFTNDGRFLIAAEAADYVHIYDTYNNFEESQDIDFFGEIAGISIAAEDTFSSKTHNSHLFIGVADRRLGGLLQMRRQEFEQTVDVEISRGGGP